MKRPSSKSFGASVLILALVWLSVGVGTASAEVPFDMSYQGRLTDAVGAPLIGPVNLQMRIYDVISGGSALYIEDHIAVVVDDVGAFSLRLGAGSSLLGTFNTALFAGVNRYLEVVVDGAALTPRLIIGSVPYAMHADNAASAQAAADAAQATADANTAGVSANTSSISTNATAIGDETARATAADAVHDADIAANAAGISANTSGITGNATAVSGNTTSISTNTTGISSNAIAIGQASATDVVHDADIATNASALAALDARIAALESVPPPLIRFEACSDGVTVADSLTGLLWERKTATAGVHNWLGVYNWSSQPDASLPLGSAYVVFLADLNTSPGFAGHTDWRLPLISELQSILNGPGVTSSVSSAVIPPDPTAGANLTVQATTCGSDPCIDTDFAAVGGPTANRNYLSSNNTCSVSGCPGGAGALSIPFYLAQGNGGPALLWEGSFDNFAVRAVRAGSCSS